jgi:hypothetical protein
MFTPGLHVPLKAPAHIARKMVLVLPGFSGLVAGRYEAAVKCFEEVRDQPTHPRFAMSWHRRLFARLGLAETWLATKNLALAVRGADALVTTFPDAATRI